MSSRGIASSLSVVFSLGLIVAVVIALTVQAQRRPPIAPTAVPAIEKMAAKPVPARPKVAAATPVVLPPPPTPAPNPVSKTAVAQENKAPQPAEIEQKPALKNRPKAVEAERPPPAAEVKVAAPRPRKPKPKPSATVKPVQTAPKRITDRSTRAARPSPAAKRAATPPRGEAMRATQEDVAEGRTLLRLLEFGSGPTIELAWPDTAAQRETLFATLGQCFGMQVALMDASGRLFVAAGTPNAPWNLNLDRFSGFIREPAGQLSRQERRALERIRIHHHGLYSESPVRVFPRTVDAGLLGGLRRLLGARYATARAIRARYRIDGRRLLVEQVVADGRKIEGRLEIPPIERSTCRRSA